MSVDAKPTLALSPTLSSDKLEEQEVSSGESKVPTGWKKVF